MLIFETITTFDEGFGWESEACPSYGRLKRGRRTEGDWRLLDWVSQGQAAGVEMQPGSGRASVEAIAHNRSIESFWVGAVNP